MVSFFIRGWIRLFDWRGSTGGEDMFFLVFFLIFNGKDKNVWYVKKKKLRLRYVIIGFYFII